MEYSVNKTNSRSRPEDLRTVLTLAFPAREDRKA